MTPSSLTAAIWVLEDVKFNFPALSVSPSYTLNPWLTDTSRVWVSPCAKVTTLSATCSLAIPILVYKVAVWNSPFPIWPFAPKPDTQTVPSCLMTVVLLIFLEPVGILAISSIYFSPV